MANIWEKAISILAGNLNLGRSYISCYNCTMQEVKPRTWILNVDFSRVFWCTSTKLYMWSITEFGPKRKYCRFAVHICTKVSTYVTCVFSMENKKKKWPKLEAKKLHIQHSTYKKSASSKKRQSCQRRRDRGARGGSMPPPPLFVKIGFYNDTS